MLLLVNGGFSISAKQVNGLKLKPNVCPHVWLVFMVVYVHFG